MSFNVACPNCGRTLDVTLGRIEFKFVGRECWNCGMSYLKLFHMKKPNDIHPVLREAMVPHSEAQKRFQRTIYDYKITDHVKGVTRTEPEASARPRRII